MKNTYRLLLFLVAVIVMSTAAVAQDQVTFTKDVVPILQQYCQVCHRAGMIAPMSLVTYQETRPWAKAIKAKVLAREMPPWFIDKNVGIQHFDNDISLSDTQISTLVKWADSGALQGSPADMPPPRQFPEGQVWQFGGKPDLTVTLPKDLVVKADGPDWWPDILVDPGLTEDRYIQAMQLIPTKGYNVVHHVRMLVVRPGGTNDTDVGSDGEDVAEQGAELHLYQIGTGADVYREGSGFLLKAGSKINFAFHLHGSGKKTPANVVLGLKFYPKEYKPQNAIIIRNSGAGIIDLRPNEANVRSDSYMPLTKPTRLLSFQPHIHLRGKAICVEAIYPNAKIENLNCARFDFNWMVNYTYADDSAPLLPAGTILHTVVWHDNSAANKSNPDPDAQIGWGSRSIDEMGHAFFTYYHMSDADFKKETEARKAK
jgi:hypothetical protein